MKTDFSWEARKRMAGDRQRPLYHFLPPFNWLNDPNGLTYWKGAYHLFYQHNPEQAVWGNIHWGHATSKDLIHWQDLPIALAPTPNGADRDGVWTGCAVDDGGTPTLVYTGRLAEKEPVCLATSLDGLLTWQKDPANPVIPSAPEGMNLIAFRDPFVWTEAGQRFMVLGGGVTDRGGVTFLYRVTDLRKPEYIGQLLASGTNEYGIAWECPNIFRYGKKHVLIFSAMAQGRTVYFSGTFDWKRFAPEISGEVDSGGYCYAPQIFVDPSQGKERILMMGWANEGRSTDAQVAAGWAGVLTLPRLLSLTEDGKLVSEPAPEIQNLRMEHQASPSKELRAGEAHTLPMKGTCLEIAVDIEGQACVAGLKVYCSSDHSEETLLSWDSQAGRLTINRDKSSLSASMVRDEKFGTVEGNKLSLRIFLDRSILEVFANGTCCLTSRVYPTRLDSTEVQLFCQQGKVEFYNIGHGSRVARRKRNCMNEVNVVVKLYGNLRKLKAASRVDLQAGSVRQALLVMCEGDEALFNAITDGEKLLPYVKVMVNGHDITFLDGLDTRLMPEDQIAIFPPIAGGLR